MGTLKKTLRITNTAHAADIIKKGGLVAFPTETVYGLGANAFDESAVNKIFTAKGRPSDNPLIVHIQDISELARVADDIPDIAYKLAEEFMPGALSLVLRKKPCIPYAVTAGLETVAVRMPNCELALDFIRECGVPIAAPSANISGRPSPTRSAHVLEDLDGAIDAVICGGDCTIGVESTVILAEDKPVLLRSGGVTLEDIEAVIGHVNIHTGKSAAPPSPGMKYKHYAPKAKIIICDKLPPPDDKIGILKFDDDYPYEGVNVLSLGSRTNPEQASRNLFDRLRKFDSLDVDVIYAPQLPATGLWRAVRNRLHKAAGT